ncbi:MAG: hypothetical protein RIS34_1352, partial [Pseudomonadota bacterium]
LVPRLADFLRDYPEVRLELDMSDRLSSMAPEGFDLAIRHTAAPPDTHVAWTLCTTRSVLVASRSYLRKRGVPAMPGDLVAHNCLHYPRAHDAPVWTFEPEVPENVKENQVRQVSERVVVPVSGSLSANNSEALRDAALTGLGVALLPDFTAQSSLQTGKLVQVLPHWKPVGAFAGQLYAIRPYSAHVPSAVTAFVAYLRQTLAAGFSLAPASTHGPGRS